MSSCQAELPETTFEVSAIDQKGNELFKGSKTT